MAHNSGTNDFEASKGTETLQKRRVLWPGELQRSVVLNKEENLDGWIGRRRAFWAKGETRSGLKMVSGPVQTEESGDPSLAKLGYVRGTEGKARRKARSPRGHGQRGHAKGSQLYRKNLQTLQMLLGMSLYKQNASILQGPSESQTLRATYPGRF